MNDIDYLKGNSYKQSFIFFVDSSHRDYNYYPNPNQYRVFFDEPFRNVFALEVLDLYIPDTEYTIEENHNEIFFKLETDTEYRRCVIDIGNYEDKSEILADSITTSFTDVLPDNVSIIVENVSTPSIKRGKFVFKSNVPFSILGTFDVKDTKYKLTHILGFSEIPTFNSNIMYAIDPTNSNVYKSVQNSIYYDTFKFENIDMIYNIGYIHKRERDKIIQKIIVEKNGTLNKIKFNISNINKLTSSENITMNFELLNVSYTCLYKTNIDVQETINSQNVSVLDINITLVENDIIYFVFSSTDFSCDFLINYVNNLHETYIVTPSDINDFEYNLDSMQRTNSYVYYDYQYDNNETPISLSMSVELIIPNYIIEAPYVYNLIGERYVLLKSNDIQEHLYLSKQYEDSKRCIQNIGLAKIPLGVYGFSKERINYNGIKPQEFHPIGKLDSFDLYFEKMDGQLYDFKGINHTITFAIHYYLPKMNHVERLNTRYQLNVNYNPDYMEYVKKDLDKNLHNEYK